MPADASEIAGDLTEVRAHVRLSEQGSGCGGEQVLEEPSQNDGVADGDAERRKHGHDADGFADARCVGHASEFEGFAERSHRAASHGAAKRHLAHHAGKAEQHDEEQVGDKEGGSAKLRDAVREQPDA